MANDYQRLKSRLLQLRGQSSRIIAPEELAGRILNMELTEAGTLRSVVGPVEYHPATYNDTGGSVPTATVYNTPHLGIFHCKLQNGKRDILLVHYQNGSNVDGIYLHTGFNRGWQDLVSINSGSQYTLSLEDSSDARPSFLTQFEATPQGVVIVVQGHGALFYDGETIAPLGFSEIPGPPQPHGPKSGYTDDGAAAYLDTANTAGFAYTGRDIAKVFGENRIGSIKNDAISVSATANDSNPLGGILEAGEWRAAIQYVDHWGNLSAISGLSAPARCSKEDNLTKDRKGDVEERAEKLRIMLAWSGLSIGPDHCVARNFYRTRDQKNSGIPGLFWVSPNAVADPNTFATWHDNSTQVYVDNVPDSWLVARPFVDPDPVPRFKLCKQAFGRLWIANTDTEPGMLRPSEPGKWGTFPKGQEIYPDAAGAEITGLWTAAQGLLVFTETSTFIITESSANRDFNAATLQPFVGCVSPDSIDTLPNGMTVWLGREGFYGFDGEKVVLLSSDIKEGVIRRINKGRRIGACSAVDPKMGEYRCWIPVDGSTVNSLCVVYDGQSWRERDDIKAAAVCTTRDHRQYMLALGSVDTGSTSNSVWLLDHAAKSTKTPAARDSIIETHWLRNTRAHRRGSPMRVTIWFRETVNASATIEVMRDWRTSPVLDGGEAPTLYTSEDPPPFWDTAVYGSTALNELTESVETVAWVKRRPYWSKVDVFVPSCEVFKFRIKYQGDMEFVGISYEEVDRHGGGTKLDQGGQV